MYEKMASHMGVTNGGDGDMSTGPKYLLGSVPLKICELFNILIQFLFESNQFMPLVRRRELHSLLNAPSVPFKKLDYFNFAIGDRIGSGADRNRTSAHRTVDFRSPFHIGSVSRRAERKRSSIHLTWGLPIRLRSDHVTFRM